MDSRDWNYVKDELCCLYHRVNLDIDGYKVTFELVQVSTFKNTIQFFINGWFKGEWLLNDCEERRRFFRPSTYHLYPQKVRKQVSKKKHPEIHIEGTSYFSTWNSFRSLKAHLIKNNGSIKLLKEG